MAEIVATGQVASLREILRDLGDRLAEQRATALLEREPDGWTEEVAAREALVFGPWRPGLDPDTYDRGYVFTETFQVAWQRGDAGAGFAASYVGAGPAPEAFGPGREVCAGAERRYMLWGTRAGAGPDPGAVGLEAHGEFKEGRLPNPICPFRYPVVGSVKEACLVAREFADPATGEVVACRSVAVVGVEDAV